MATTMGAPVAPSEEAAAAGREGPVAEVMASSAASAPVATGSEAALEAGTAPAAAAATATVDSDPRASTATEVAEPSEARAGFDPPPHICGIRTWGSGRDA